MIAPHEANLNEEFPFACQRDDGVHVGEFGHRRFFEVKMFASAEREQRVRGVVADFRLDGDDAGTGEELVLQDHLRTELLADLPSGGRGIAGTDEFPVATTSGSSARPRKAGRNPGPARRGARR